MQAHRAADLLPAGIALHHGAMVLLVDDQVMVGEAIRRALASEPDIEFHYCSDPA